MALPDGLSGGLDRAAANNTPEAKAFSKQIENFRTRMESLSPTVEANLNEALLTLEQREISNPTEHALIVSQLLQLWERAEYAKLLSQLSLESRIADQCAITHGNPLSDFHVGAAVLGYPSAEDKSEYELGHGSNSETDGTDYGNHAETAAIAAMKQYWPADRNIAIDLMVCTESSCGACRAAFYSNARDDTSLLVYIDAMGKVEIGTRRDWLPQLEDPCFQVIPPTDAPLSMLRHAYAAAALDAGNSFTEERLPATGYCLGVRGRPVADGTHTGTDAFWPATAPIDAIARYNRSRAARLLEAAERLCYGHNNRVFRTLRHALRKRRPTAEQTKQALQRIDQVAIFYDRRGEGIMPPGIERQQLADLRPDCEIYIVVGEEPGQQVYKTTRAEWLPGAFTKATAQAA
jgi:cytidine deaminase